MAEPAGRAARPRPAAAGGLCGRAGRVECARAHARLARPACVDRNSEGSVVHSLTVLWPRTAYSGRRLDTLGGPGYYYLARCEQSEARDTDQIEETSECTCFAVILRLFIPFL